MPEVPVEVEGFRAPKDPRSKNRLGSLALANIQMLNQPKQKTQHWLPPQQEALSGGRRWVSWKGHQKANEAFSLPDVEKPQFPMQAVVDWSKEVEGPKRNPGGPAAPRPDRLDCAHHDRGSHHYQRQPARRTIDIRLSALPGQGLNP